MSDALDPEKEAIRKMKQAAMEGIPGEPVGESEIPVLATAATAGGEDIQLPPHRRILSVRSETDDIVRKASKVPAAKLNQIVFALSTHEDSDPAPLTVGEVRLLINQLKALNQDIEGYQKALAICRKVLEDIKAGGARHHEVIDAIAAIKTVRP